MVRGSSTSLRVRALPRIEAIPAVYLTVVVFAVVFPILAFNTAPGISFHDSGEFSLALASAGIPHSPGAPAWALFALIFKQLTFGVEAARAANLFSTFCGSLTVAFCSAFVFRHFSDRSNAVRILAAVIAALSIICTGSFLEQSLIAEQYTLMTATMAAILLTIQTNDANPQPKWYALMGLLWGLDMGNHPSQIILGWLFLVPIIQKRREVSPIKAVLCGLGGLAMGLSVFLYLPIRAAAHPAMNWGHPSTWKQFVWNVLREQWPTRHFNEAPNGFIKNWFQSYNLFGEMGFISTALAVFGLVLGIRRGWRPLTWLFFLCIPYGVLMLAGHLHQKGMDLPYIRFYGVRDWHIPLFMGLSVLAAMGSVWLLDLRHKCTEKVRVGTLSTIALSLGGFFPFQMSKETMRGYVAPLNYTKAYFAGLPQNAILSPFCDDGAHMTSYEHYANHYRPDVYVTFGMPQNGLNETNSNGWDLQMKEFYLTQCITEPTQNPISLPFVLSKKECDERALFTEFTAGECKWLADYCLPHGYIVQLLERKTTDAEVLQADHDFQAQHPEMFQKPVGPQHRLTREAFSYAFLRRGLFFMRRKMYPMAKEALETAIAWEPTNPQILLPYGATLEELKDYMGAEKAYRTCIDYIPEFTGPRQNLALLYAYDGQYDLALDFAHEELELTKGEPAVKRIIGVIEEQKAKHAKKP